MWSFDENSVFGRALFAQTTHEQQGKLGLAVRRSGVYFHACEINQKWGNLYERMERSIGWKISMIHTCEKCVQELVKCLEDENYLAFWIMKLENEEI